MSAKVAVTDRGEACVIAQGSSVVQFAKIIYDIFKTSRDFLL